MYKERALCRYWELLAPPLSLTLHMPTKVPSELLLVLLTLPLGHLLLGLKVLVRGILVTIDLHVGHVTLFRSSCLVHLDKALILW